MGVLFSLLPLISTIYVGTMRLQSNPSTKKKQIEKVFAN